MRRKERQITEIGSLEAAVRSAYYVTLAMPTTDAPYLVPMNFGYEDRKVYLHSVRAGRKIELLREAGGRMPVSLLFVPKAALLDSGKEIACGLSSRYISVAATGTLEEVSDAEERRRGMNRILAQVGMEGRTFTDAALAGVALLRVAIAEMIGKVNDP
jgi:nitroimidazol reductase NimA-like FMN-containing flavoprotein (pyridoxamine 5'-phosphate oxidase superfamily)